MNTLDLDALEKFTRKAQKLQAIAERLQPFLELVRQFDGKDFIPTDKLIRAQEKSVPNIKATPIVEK